MTSAGVVDERDRALMCSVVELSSCEQARAAAAAWVAAFDAARAGGAAEAQAHAVARAAWAAALRDP
ncbi:MAG TPA: hypothetical protein VGQ62_09925 [Chloroflexota bacterium]|jgi:hypothetical protein|nr:hypothetical protein [Chloroflexota bacterium]